LRKRASCWVWCSPPLLITLRGGAADVLQALTLLQSLLGWQEIRDAFTEAQVGTGRGAGPGGAGGSHAYGSGDLARA
jgi:hypothetical protein